MRALLARRGFGAAVVCGLLLSSVLLPAPAWAPPTGVTRAAARSATLAQPATTGRRFPAGARFDYQIGGGYRPAPGVRIVDRDRGDSGAPGRYNICYVNAFQAQPQETPWWREYHRGLLLHGRSGREIVDPGWGEILLDISTSAKRAALARIVGSWLDGCARHGYQAVELDNLDSYTRAHGLLHRADAVAFAALLTHRAHADHLAAAQKNAADLSPLRRRTGFDFAIAEECQVYSECGSYTRTYGRAVIEIEYTDNPVRYFTAACRARGSAISVELSDRNVQPIGRSGHIRRWC